MFSPFLPQLRIDRFRTGPIQPLLFLPGTTKRERPAGIPNQAIRKLWGAEKLRTCGELSKLQSTYFPRSPLYAVHRKRKHWIRTRLRRKAIG
jgi:hypothetical protein